MAKQILTVLLGSITLMACEPMQSEPLVSQKEIKDSRLARISEPVGFSFAKWRDEEVRISLEYTLHKNGKLEIETFENRETLDDPVGERRQISSRQVMLSRGRAEHIRTMLLRVLPVLFSSDIPINSPLGCNNTLHSSSWFFAAIFSEAQKQFRGGAFAAQNSCDGVGATMAQQYLRVFVELLPAEDKPLNYIPAW
jgi:hypothetical protein